MVLRILIGLLTLIGTATATAEPPNLVERTRPYEAPRAPSALHERLPELMRAALERPDAEARLEALVDIRRHAMTELDEAVRPLLDDERALVRSAAVQTLHKLGARGVGDRLASMLDAAPRRSPVDRGVIRAIDLALSEWAYLDAVDRWTRRVEDDQTKLRLRISAAEALGRIADALAIDQQDPLAAGARALVAVAADRSAPAVLRLAAARARGRIAGPAPIEAAEELIGERALDRLCAVAMVDQGRPERCGRLIRRAVVDRSPAVQASAMRLALRWGSDEALPLDILARQADAADPTVRELVAAGFGLHVDPSAVALVANMLADRHPSVRTRARKALARLAEKDGARPAVHAMLEDRLSEVAAAIAEDPAARWREAEQLARLAGEIDHDPVAMKLLEVLPTARTEAAVAAWYGLRRLDVQASRASAVAECRTLLDRLAELTRRAAADAEASGSPDEALADVLKRAEAAMMTLGAWREAAAEPLLLELVPKDAPAPLDARVTAVWALGMIHADQSDPDLASALVGRLNDRGGRNPESFGVRIESAVALGRMKARSALAALRNGVAPDRPPAMRAACRWAVGRITGTPQPPLEVEPRIIRDAFIRPVD